MAADAHPPFLVVGHLNRAHGKKGELFVWPLTDYPGSHFAPGIVHFPGDEEGNDPSTSLPPLTIDSVRPYRKGFLVKFDQVDRDRAKGLQGRYLFRPFEAMDDLKEGEVFYHELLGSRVVTGEGTALGTVKEVYPLQPAHLLEVTGPSGSVLLSLAPGVVIAFDREQRRVVVDPPEGLLQ